MKIVQIGFFVCASIILISCEQSVDETIKPSPRLNDVDSVVFDILITIENDQIIEMKKFHHDTVVDKIALEYLDSTVQKTVYSFDTLIQKSIFYINAMNYAEFSLDSLFNLNRFYTTNYTYNSEGYLIEEEHIPGFNFVDGEVDFTISYYNIYGGNRYGFKVLTRPPNVYSTGSYTYKYSDKIQKYDIAAYNNSILGEPNNNLPESFGYQLIDRSRFYDKEVSYDYFITNNLVHKRIDNFFKNDTIVRKEILYFYYE